MTSISIIICTRNRAGDLRETLAAIGKLAVPAEWETELIVVDNDSTDRTPDVVRDAKLARSTPRYLFEPRRGQNSAYNTALATAKGEILLFTDDDIRPPRNWIEEMVRPILTGQADAVLGAIKMAPHLERDWMTPYHRSWFTTESFIKEGIPAHLIGANMAFARRVLERVPAFDVELGPGRLGFRGDSLFSYQLHQANYRITAVSTAVVEHHFDPDRLTCDSLMKRVVYEGRSSAYIAYHWQHEHVSRCQCCVQLVTGGCALLKYRIRGFLSGRSRAVPTQAEMQRIKQIAFHKQYLVESFRPRNYDRCGLVKISGEGVK